MVDFTQVTTRLPSPILNAVNETVLQRLYEKTRLRFGNFSDARVESTCGEFEIRLPTSSAAYNIVTNTPDGYEPELQKILSSEFSPNSVFYDIGAGFGYFSSLALSCGVPDSSVHAFEADWFRSQLFRQTHSSDSVRLIRKFVGDRSDSTIALDDYASSHTPPTVVKIDVEGAEIQVVDGMEQILLNEQPKLLIELHPHKVDDGPAVMGSLVKNLQSIGYTITARDHRTSEDAPLAEFPTDRSYLIEASSN